MGYNILVVERRSSIGMVMGRRKTFVPQVRMVARRMARIEMEGID